MWFQTFAPKFEHEVHPIVTSQIQGNFTSELVVMNCSMFSWILTYCNWLFHKFHHDVNNFLHGLRTPREEIAFTARPKFHSQIFRYCRSIFCLPHRPNFSDIFDLCLHLVSVVRASVPLKISLEKNLNFWTTISTNLTLILFPPSNFY